LTTWQFTDRPVVRRLVEQITDTIQLWLNNLVARGALLMGQIYFPRPLNPDGELILGHITFQIQLTPPTPAADIEFLLKYDPAGLQTLFIGQNAAAAQARLGNLLPSRRGPVRRPALQLLHV
jgi:phage tail sheath protein FI